MGRPCLLETQAGFVSTSWVGASGPCPSASSHRQVSRAVRAAARRAVRLHRRDAARLSGDPDPVGPASPRGSEDARSQASAAPPPAGATPAPSATRAASQPPRYKPLRMSMRGSSDRGTVTATCTKARRDTIRTSSTEFPQQAAIGSSCRITGRAQDSHGRRTSPRSPW